MLKLFARPMAPLLTATSAVIFVSALAGCGGGGGGPSNDSPDPTPTPSGTTTPTPTPLPGLVPELSDEFNAGSLASKWGYVGDGSAAAATFSLQRTSFRNPPQFPSGAGVMRLRLDTYRPGNDGTGEDETTGNLLSGTEVLSKTEIARGNGVEYTARLRLVRDATDPIVPGFVLGFFAYSQKGSGQSLVWDEIDIELATNRLFDNQSISTNGDATQINRANADPRAFWTNLWNDRDPRQMPLQGPLDWSQGFHIFTLRWLPDRVDYLLDNIVVRTVPSSVPEYPNDPMGVRFNIWAPSSPLAPTYGWSYSWSDAIKPVAQQSQNKSYYMDVDYIRVSRIGASTTAQVRRSLNSRVARPDATRYLRGQ